MDALYRKAMDTLGSNMKSNRMKKKSTFRENLSRLFGSNMCQIILEVVML